VRTDRDPSKRILVVEDDRAICSAVVELLVEEGYAVEAAGDGKQALEIVEERPPSAILLDLMMPVMDGWTFLSVCRADVRCREIPIVVMSAAYNLQEHVARLTSLGARAVISKPFDLQAVLDIMQRYAPLRS